jgi:enoyl-CoA hydratase/carnithine racemase
MTLPTDIRIAAQGARLALPFTRRGFVPDSCSSWFLPRVVDPQQAAEWILTGRTFGADEALAGGLVRSIHPADEVTGVAMDWRMRSRITRPRCRPASVVDCCGR